MRLNTYLNFDGHCRTAFEFYAQCLNGQIEMMMTHANTPQANCPAEYGERIMHARLNAGGMVLMGSDSMPGQHTPAQGFHVSVNVDTTEEAERIFHALSQNGSVKMPIQPTFWSPRFGMLVDQFGTPWMVNCDQAPG